ncbi:MAG TPA: OsmC family protein [Polyangia bacterium]|nr:OsmC family protein [Polyangia bacterium]
MSVRKASAVWKGNLKQGNGTFSTGSGVLSNTPYDFGKRFGEDPGTNPEELIAAAQAACFSMALSADLEKAGFIATSIDTSASLTFEAKDGKPTITKIHLDTVAKVPNLTADALAKTAEGTRVNCPISRVLKTEITVSAKLA